MDENKDKNSVQNTTTEQNQEESINTNINRHTGIIIVSIVLLVIVVLGSIYGITTNNDSENNNNDINTAVEKETEENTTNINDTNNINKENNVNEINTGANSTGSNNIISNETITSSSENAKQSTKESPLKLNEWGLAAKRVSKELSEEYAEKNYIDVPVRITKITRGEEATEIVKKWYDNQDTYKYEDPEAYTQWAVVDYEVDLSNVKFDEGIIGTSTDVSSSVKGLDGLSIKYNGTTYILSTINTSSKEYVKEPGVYKCQFIVTLPEGCTDYLIILGNSSNGEESYFKCE